MRRLKRPLAFLCLAGVIALVAAKVSAEQGSEPSPVATRSDGCLVDSTAVDDLRKARAELDASRREVAAREKELAARETALDEELKKIQEVRDQITGIRNERKAEFQERVAKLVETFENMSPKSAATLFESLDEQLAVEAMARISTQKLAKIIGLMEPAKSSRLTELMAGVARAKLPESSRGRLDGRDAQGSAVATNAKGGEMQNGNQQ